MKRSRFSEEQIIGILKEHQAGLSAQDLCRKHGISDATFYKWRSKYGGMDISDARRLKALEEENRKLKICWLNPRSMRPHSKRCSEKTFNAQGAENGRELGDQGQTLLAASCVRVGRPGAEDLPLCLEAA